MFLLNILALFNLWFPFFETTGYSRVNGEEKANILECSNKYISLEREVFDFYRINL